MKKWISLLLAACLAGGALAACGNDVNDLPADVDNTAGGDMAPDDATGETDGEAVAANGAESGSFTYWSYTDSAQNLVEAFTAAYPDIQIDLQIFGGDEYKTKLLTTIQSGKNIPDLFDLEEGYAYEFLESDALEDLGARGLAADMDDFYDYLVAGGKTPDGTLKGLTFQSSPVGFWYLRDAMEEWLGTSDPDELAGMLGSWDDIKTLAAQVKEDSNGSVYLWPNIVEMVKVVGYSFEPMVRDGVFDVGGEWYELLDTMRDFYESGVTADLGSWSEQWAAEWNEGNLLIRVMPSWDFFTDWEKNEGNVGIIKPFENSFEGATIVSMYSGSDNKDVCDTFLQYLTTSEWQTYNMETYNQVPASSGVAKDLAAGYESADFGGQNLMKTYDEINSGVADITPDKYTRSVQNLFQRHASEGIQNGQSNEEIIEALKAEVADQYPELVMN